MEAEARMCSISSGVARTRCLAVSGAGGMVVVMDAIVKGARGGEEVHVDVCFDAIVELADVDGAVPKLCCGKS